MKLARGNRTAAVLLTLACLITLALSTSALASPARAPAGPRATLILDEPAPSTLFEDQETLLTGRLSSGRADKQVLVERLLGGSWRKIGETATTDKGEFALGYHPVDPGNEVLRAVHQTRQHEVVSETQPLEVFDRRVFLATQPSWETFDDVSVYGTVRPRFEGARIAIQRLVAGRWLKVRSGYTDATGRYEFSMPNNLPGVWFVRAYWPGPRPAEGTAEFSAVHRYLVRAALDPVVTRVTREQLGGSFHAGCPVGAPLLRNVALTFRTFAATVGRGTLVVRSTIVDDMVAAFGAALTHGYPIRRMYPTARYGGSDIRSMAHDNTSAFNCRHVTGDPTRLSPHSYGTALDVDTVENPYQDIHGIWWPRTKGQEFRDRGSARPGMLYASSDVTKSLTARGFQWGGIWSHPDYQHFDTGSAKRGGPSAARRAGPLNARSMPLPSALGAGWRRYHASGAGAGGRSVEGSFVRARDGREASLGVLPLGCQAHIERSLPVPGFALQGSYISSKGALGQAVVMQFGSATAAGRYFAGLLRALQACDAPDGPSGVTVRPDATSASSYRGDRSYAGGERWRERDSRTGARVTVLLMGVETGS